ncbi:SMC-Scp complex subunit ScpB [Aliikangiella sp. IMCC44359]|uniref:SMC-Scp complex subunit ScpB n=1 Tax=Aliikangiella sp. IMCC44359 TaxID=3459125 RepID=UPI00403AD959
MSIDDNKLKNIIESALMSVGKPMSVEQMMKLFDDEEMPSASRVKDALELLQKDCEGRGIELKEIASGYRYQARQDYSSWISRLWEEKPAKYSRAYLETLALIAYRQPVTRAEIEEVRGVSVSSHIIKTMLEREWIRVVGHRDVPGRPSLYATTKQFLDYFNMKSLEELPTLAEIRDLDELSPELELTEPEHELPSTNEDSAEAREAEQNITESELKKSELEKSELKKSELEKSELEESELEESELEESELEESELEESELEESELKESELEESELEKSELEESELEESELEESELEESELKESELEESELEESELEEAGLNKIKDELPTVEDGLDVKTISE